MNLRKILSKVVTAALIVTTVGVVEPAKAYAADIAYEWIDVDGTNEWKVNKDFSAEFTIDSKTTTGTKNNNLTCTYALYDGETRVYHPTLGKKYKLDKTKNYTLQVYVFDSTGNNYFDSVERGYINGLNVYKQTSSDTDPYFNITTEQTCFEITKKLTYVPLINAFVANDSALDAGDVLITGPNGWKPGDTFDGSKYKAIAETGLPLSIQTRLEDENKNVLYDSSSTNKTTPVKLEKGKWYKRWIFVHVGNSERSDYAFGDTGKVKINGREYEHGFGPDKWSIEIESWMNYYTSSGSICDSQETLDLGVVSLDGTFDWCDGEKFVPDFKVKSSEGYNLKKHVCLLKDGELVYDSNDSKYSEYTIKKGEFYKLIVYVSIVNSETEEYDFSWIGSVDALLVNGKSTREFGIIDDSNAIEYSYLFIGGEAKSDEVEPTKPKNDQPKVETKKKQKAKVKAKSKTLKVKKAKKGLKLEKLITVKNAKGKVTYKIKSSKPKKGFKINKKGVIILKKKLSKGSYNLKVTVTAAGNKEYKKFSKTVTVKIKVK